VKVGPKVEKEAGMIRTNRVFIAFLAATTIVLSIAPGAWTAEKVTPPANVISTNPILDIFTWYNLEFEHRIRSNSTIGLSGSYVNLSDNDDTYAQFTGFYRYYPQNDAPAGFFFGGRLGIVDVNTKSDPPAEDESTTLTAVGIDIGYGWMIGTTRNFSISVGIGGVRLFGSVDNEDTATTLPTIRFVNLGFGF
jgi:hypothetical protein